MKIYLINNDIQAKQISQLLRLNAECVKFQWSTIIKDIPNNVRESLECIEMYIEEKIYEVCTENNLVGRLTEEEENELFALIRKKQELKYTIGTGIVVAGEEANKVSELLKSEKVSQNIIDAINSGKSVVLF